MIPGWDSDWWGRDPIEQAGEDPREREEMADTYNEFDPGFRIGHLMFSAETAFADLLEASPWLARQFLDECEEKMRPRLPSVHRQSA
jgi:hypothetical protein